MHPKDRKYTGFATRKGFYQWKVTPMGASNSGAIFQRIMEVALGELRFKCAMVYIDDIIIFSKTFEDHVLHIKEVIEKLEKAGLYLKLNKCEFCMEEIEILKHFVSADGIKPSPKKTEAIDEYPTPDSPEAVSRFLGMAGYYRKFIENFAKRTVHIRKAKLMDKHAFSWTKAANDEFSDIKKCLTSGHIMALPDMKLPFILATDASCKNGIGAILSQIQEGRERVIAYASRTLNEYERNYAPTKAEALALVWSILFILNHT